MRLAYEAGEENNVRNLRTRYLTAIRSDLQDRMISVDIPDHWTLSDLMGRVIAIEENLFRAKLGGAMLKQETAAHKDSMDWAPTGAYLGRMSREGPRRAKWASNEERNRRREGNLCLRCGEPGHYIDKCSMRPARNPEAVRIAAATMTTDNDTSTRGESDSEN